MKIDLGTMGKGIQETVSNTAGEVRKDLSETGAATKEQVQQGAEPLKQAGQMTAEDRRGSMTLSAGILARNLSGQIQKSAGSSGSGSGAGESGAASGSSAERKESKATAIARELPKQIDVDNLKPNINLKDLTRGENTGRGEHRTDGVHGLDTKNQLTHKDGDQMKIRGGLRGMENHAIDTGLNNRGTFGDDRLNRGRRTDPGDFRGMDGDHAAQGWNRTGTGRNANGEKVTTYKNSSGDTRTVTQTDNGEVTFTQRKDGSSSAWYEDKNGNPTKIVETAKDGSQKVSTWDEAAQDWWVQKSGPGGTPVKMPNPDADESGNWKPVVLPGTNVDHEMKAGFKPKGQADDGGDGRNPDADTTQGSSEHSGVSIMMGSTHGQESKVGQSGGTVDFDKALEINTKINPTRN